MVHNAVRRFKHDAGDDPINDPIGSRSRHQVLAQLKRMMCVLKRGVSTVSDTWINKIQEERAALSQRCDFIFWKESLLGLDRLTQVQAVVD